MPWTNWDLCGSKVRETGKPNRKIQPTLLGKGAFLTGMLDLNNGPLVVRCWIKVKEDFCLGKMKGWLVSSKSRPESHFLERYRTIRTETFSVHQVYVSYVIHHQSVSKPVGKSIHKFDQMRLLFILFSVRGLSSLATFIIFEYKPAPSKGCQLYKP